MIEQIQIQHHRVVILLKILIKYDKYTKASNRSFNAINSNKDEVNYNKESIYGINKWMNTLEKNLFNLTYSKMKFNQYGAMTTVSIKFSS